MRIPGNIFLLALFLLVGSLAGCGGDSVIETGTGNPSGYDNTGFDRPAIDCY